MKKHIFISVHYMEIGGAEMSLVGLLHAINYTKYDVDLFISAHKGELMKFIPEQVNVLPEISEYANIENPIKEVIMHGLWKIAFARLKAKVIYFILKKKGANGTFEEYYNIIERCVSPYLPTLKHLGCYDLAINYIGIGQIVLNKILAKKKITWLHTDYSTVRVNAEKNLPGLSSFDHIVSISPDVTKAFLNTYPSLKDKIIEMENILSSSFVRERAELISQSEIEKEMPCEENTIRLLSIGRFCEAKNYDNVPDICKRINSQLSTLNSQLKVKWYIIGWGSDESLIRQKIAEVGVEDYVILLGKKTNPYPYIKACNIYCQPSRYEGKSITVREAQMLCKPVVITNYLTAQSQINNGVDGLIVPMDNEGCAKGIFDFVFNTPLQESIVRYLTEHDCGNTDEIRKLYSLI